MKKFLSLIFAFGLLLSACGTTETQISPSTESSTPTLTPTATQTPIPPTSTVTPLPTIPTFTPTFDVSTIVTVTPVMKKVECPKENPSLKPDTQVLFNLEGLQVLKEQALLDYLNNGGTPKAVIDTFIQKFNWFHPDMGIQQDITGDGVDEFILTDDRVVFVFGCNNGEYQTWLSDTDEPMWLRSIRFNTSFDMNMNGIPEIVTDEQGGHGIPTERLSIFEWNGSAFTPLIQGEAYNSDQYFSFAEMPFLPDVTIQDTDENGTVELVLESNLPSPISSQYAHLIPWRNETHIYSWNGTLFTLSRVKFTKAQYRFQAAQDADRELLDRNYDRALSLYQDVIFNNELKTWSPAIAENEIAKAYTQDGSQSTPTPPAPDLSESSSLAAYAYYRIMLLYLTQGQEPEAATTYQTLQDTFSNDLYAAPYIEMATAFWESYQSTHEMYDGCAAAIQYAVEHPDILIPLGSDYHGSQSHTYKPEDVCPFR